MKYKAILELEQFPDIDRMLDITKNLDCYDYDPVIVSAADYGERQLEKSGFVSTSYGMIIRNDLPFEQEFAEPDQGMTMA